MSRIDIANPLREYCTYFDRNFIPQGLALYSSLRRWGPPEFRLWILCLDEETRAIVKELALPRVSLVTRAQLVASESRLADAERNRSEQEFFYVCTPALLTHVMRSSRSATEVTYLDADVYFFGSAERVYDGHPEGTEVIIVPHDSGSRELEERVGRFNVSLVHFTAGAAGMACLEWWLRKCLESTRLGNGVWGDQKYLDAFPEQFAGVAIAASPSIALAPWNIKRHLVECRPDGTVVVDREPLTAYHFARYLVVSEHFAAPTRKEYIPRRGREHLYRPYMKACRAALRQIKSVRPDYRVRYTRHNLRGIMLGALSGRIFYEGSLGLRRVGVYIPSSMAELRPWREERRTQKSRDESLVRN